MRLSSQSQHIIRDTVHEIFGPDANVLVFGSRVDDATRGGDLDLLVKTDEAVPDGRRKTLQLVAKLQMRLGDQPIDVLLLDAETDRQPVHEEAMRTGVRL
jgi:predicted nucleotidyltransferase